jgi:hypothetical protein
MYSRREVNEVRLKASFCICRNSSGIAEVIRDVYIATLIAGGRLLNVALFWLSWGAVSWDAKSRTKGSSGIDRRRQNKEEYGSGEEFGEHLANNKEWMKVRRIVVRSEKYRDCGELVL